MACAGQVLVRIAASGVNPLDLTIREGAAAHARHTLPAITRFRPGDEVYGMTGGVGGHPGSLAQFASVDADLLARKPANVGMREASIMPLVFITAWEGLVDRMAVRAAQSVLVLGGAGGVGQMAIQIARARGVTVFATGSSSADKTVVGLGAHFIDRAESVESFVARLTGDRGFDVVYDTVGGHDAGWRFPGGETLRPCGECARLGSPRVGTAVISGRELFGDLHPSAAADG